MMADEGSNIPVTNESEHYTDVDDDDDLCMEESEFYKILFEDQHEKDAPTNVNAGIPQDGGPNLILVHDEDAINHSGNTSDAYMGNGAMSDTSAETIEVQGPYDPTVLDMPFVPSDSSIASTPGFLCAEGDSFYSCSSEEVTGGISEKSLPSTAHYPLSSNQEYLMDTDYLAANPQSSDPLLEKDMFSVLEGGSYAPIHFPSKKQLGSASNSVNAAQLSGLNLHDSLSIFTDGASGLPFRWTHSPFPYRRQPVVVEKMENKPVFLSKGPRYGSYGVTNDAPFWKQSFGSNAGKFAMDAVTSGSDMKYGAAAKSENQDNFFGSGAHCVFDTFCQSGPRYEAPFIYGEYMDAKRPLNLASLDTLPSAGFGFNKVTVEMAKETHSTIASSTDVKPQPYFKPQPYIKPHPMQVSSMDDDEDPDVCIIENTDVHARFPAWSHGRYQLSSQASTLSSENADLPKQVAPFQSLEKSVASFQNSSYSSAIVPVVADTMKSKSIDERLIFQEAVQDILSQDASQSHLETSPPDGLMSVPLLRHQRIALSWMVKKETVSWHCCGGILADDQGLGKTISTIALILTERAVPFKMTQSTKIVKHETLDLDEVDDKDTKENIVMDSDQKNGTLVKNPGPCSTTKGRPPGGTLIVCPTSVIRQWAAELRSKVTSKANLLVCTYHGGSRTKDPFELAKYDVVLTTYSIVSMEVRKQSSNDKDEEMLEADDAPPYFIKKRKNSSKFSDQCSKKGKYDGLNKPECPLERIRWFRVVLDEAQSIKNFRTRVAQACWALRAKRRWCLSGTPLQNVVDDLYSYFRFLRYDPYTTYKAFHELVKLPISRTPTKGYQKLQAVLKTIMLRRTKATLLDGEPIVNLPPKSVVLKKVEFSTEERDFYCKLEADSRARFAEYEADGTVEKNYVNILVMLLRLRQACNHPFLVQGFDSSSVWSSSVDSANKLPREEKLTLLTCLEASFAICGICNDSPEDAVVSRCGHVFCNQCISEHFLGDDKQCPAKNCKVQISKSSVFSGATLKRCLDESLGNSSLDSSSHSSPCSEVIEPSQVQQLHHSSKVKAALQVLQSLNKPPDVVVGNSCEGPVKVEQSDNASPQTSVAQTGSSGVAPTIEVKGSIIKIKTGSSNPVLVHKNSLPVHKEKTIVFSQWVKMLDLLESCLKESSIQFRRLDGTMTVHARDKAVQDFNTLPEVTVMIMSLKAASLGLNLVVANHVLLMDLWWNPTTEDQAIDRAHRIGQTRPVSVLRLTVADTVEDRILALQEKKREMVASAFGEDKAGGRGGRLDVEDLRYLFRM